LKEHMYFLKKPSELDAGAFSTLLSSEN
jgi:hypothetical protein